MVQSPDAPTGDPCFRRTNFTSRGEIRSGTATRQRPAYLPSTHHHPMSVSTTTSPGRLQPRRAGRPSDASPKLPGPHTRAPRQSQLKPSAQQEQRALARTPKSAGHGKPAPLAASPAQDTRTYERSRERNACTYRHASGARETEGLTARLVCRTDKHVSSLAVTKAPPLERRKDTDQSAQTNQHHTVLPVEQGSHCQGTQVPDEQARHRAQVATGPGIMSVAKPQVLSSITNNHLRVCNEDCNPYDKMSLDDKPVVQPIFKPLPPSVVRMLAEYRRKHCRKGIRIHPWVRPVGPDVPLPASKVNVASQLR